MGWRVVTITPALLGEYVQARQLAGAANGTINRELAVLLRMLRLAYEHGKLIRLPVIPEAQGGVTPGRLLRAGGL